MKKYLSFFRLRFVMGMQYRAAALAGVSTQFFWGLMEVMIFIAFYEADAAAFPMSLSATISYVWLQQAFLAFFAVWMLEGEIFEAIRKGNLAYELARPVDIYNMWFARSVANRLSRAVLRCFPILLIAVFVPAPYGLRMPASLPYFMLFLAAMVLGLAVTVSVCMLIYVLTFFTISPRGVRMVFISAIDFLAGAIIPIPFFPEKLAKVLEMLPFAAMQNVPLRIYSGSLNGTELVQAISLQIFWLVVITLMGKILCRKAEKSAVVQGG